MVMALASRIQPMTSLQRQHRRRRHRRDEPGAAAAAQRRRLRPCAQPRQLNASGQRLARVVAQPADEGVGDRPADRPPARPAPAPPAPPPRRRPPSPPRRCRGWRSPPPACRRSAARAPPRARGSGRGRCRAPAPGRPGSRRGRSARSPTAATAPRRDRPPEIRPLATRIRPILWSCCRLLLQRRRQLPGAERAGLDQELAQPAPLGLDGERRGGNRGKRKNNRHGTLASPRTCEGDSRSLKNA